VGWRRPRWQRCALRSSGLRAGTRRRRPWEHLL